MRAQSGHRPYARLFEVIIDRAHPEHRETLTWCGGRFDPEAFNLDRTNRDIEATLRPNPRIRYRQWSAMLIVAHRSSKLSLHAPRPPTAATTQRKAPLRAGPVDLNHPASGGLAGAENLLAEIRRGRSDRRSSLWSTPPRSRPRTSFPRRRRHRLRQGRAARSSSRR
jgi:hypothetical protein